MFKIFLTIIIVFIISIYMNFGINLWQAVTENMDEIEDNGPIFYPEYITINPFKDKNLEE